MSSQRASGKTLKKDPEDLEPGRVVVIGCGNPLRGDDAVGSMVARGLRSAPLSRGVVVVEAGTAGIDVAFRVRGADKAVVIDAASTGAPPGTIVRLSGEELERLPRPEVLDTHSLRWDHALAFGRRFLGEAYPEEVVVFLIEIAQTEPGAPLSDAVGSALQEVRDLVLAEIEARS